ncbi:hypothetical protein HYC85_018910, partial [Camellia sinensis]
SESKGKKVKDNKDENGTQDKTIACLQPCRVIDFSDGPELQKSVYFSTASTCVNVGSLARWITGAGILSSGILDLLTQVELFFSRTYSSRPRSCLLGSGIRDLLIQVELFFSRTYLSRPRSCLLGSGIRDLLTQECGPCLTLKLISLQHGTFEIKGGEYEWVHKPEMDTSGTRQCGKKKSQTYMRIKLAFYILICNCFAVLLRYIKEHKFDSEEIHD